jgi:amino acid permease
MGNYKNIFLEISLLFATTVGAGMFSLPYVFSKAGFLIGVFYLVLFTVIIVNIHYFYFQVLEKTKDKKEGLIGLMKTYFGAAGEKSAFLIIVGGLVLTLVIYLVLGEIFLKILFPDNLWGLWLFWILASLPIFLKLKSLEKTEFLGTILIIALVLYLAAATKFDFGNYNFSALNWNNSFLPFGALLFSLAGWTAVEPIFTKEKERKSAPIKFIFAGGTILAAVVYLIFILTILNLKVAGSEVLAGLLSPGLQIAAFLGLFLILTSYWPIGLEIKNGLEKDLKWPALLGGLTVLFIPLILYFLGLRNFLPLIGLAGGVFLSSQYFLIILIVKKVLSLNFWQKILINFSSLIFVLGAIYELFYFFK